MTKDEALRLAMAALVKTDAEPGSKAWEREAEAITAIKEALMSGTDGAQPEQEPVTWRYKIVDVFGRPAWTLKTPKSDTRVLESQPLYTTPPQRTWVGLTDEEKQEAYYKIDSWSECIAFIEVKLKEKNT